MINVHYALQTCDVDSKSFQSKQRYTNTPKSNIVRKCVTSFLRSVGYAARNNANCNHIIRIIDDSSSTETLSYLSTLAHKYSASYSNIEVEVVSLRLETGIANSIKACYEWLHSRGTDLVYQVQDDYLFYETAIYEMIDVFFQIFNETQSHAIISPYNDNKLWTGSYKNTTTPRAIISGKSRYWVQYYDASCSFMTSSFQFNKNVDLLQEFLRILYIGNFDSGLESISINKMLTERGILGLVPIPSLIHHIQEERDIDPHQSWEELWNEIELV